MSHFTTVRTELRNGDLVAKALDRLGFSFERGQVDIKGYEGQRDAAEFRLPTKDPDYDIGLRRAGDRYEVVADWWGISEHEEKAFAARLNREYAIVATTESLEKQGFREVQFSESPKGEVRILLRRPA